MAAPPRLAVRKLPCWLFALLVLLVTGSTSRAQIPVPADAADDYIMNSEGMYVQAPDTAEIINGEYVGFYAAGGDYNSYGGGFVEFANPDGGSFGGQNWGGLAFAGATLQDNELTPTNYSGYLFQPAPGANDYAIIGPLGTSSTNDGGPSDNDALAGASVQDIENMYGPQSGFYVYQGAFSQATSYTVDMGTNTVAVLDVAAGLLPADTGGVTEASPDLNLSGTFTARGEALIEGDDSEPVTISGSSGGSFSTPFLDLYGQVDITGGKVSGDFLLIDNEIDPNVYSAGYDTPSTATTVDVSGAGASIVSSQSLLIGRSSDAPAQLTIEQGATGTFNNVYVGCGTADSNGTLKIDSATVSVSGFIEVGAGGSGTLLVQNGATLMTGTGQSDTDTGAYINGADEDDESSATVDGEGTKWVNTGNLSIGYYANGPSTLTISNGADVQVTGELILGTEAGSDANVVLESGGTLETGTDLSGTSPDSVALAVSAPSADATSIPPIVASGNLAAIIGDVANSSATFTITGADTKWTASSLLINGYQGQGNIVVQKGATLAGDVIEIGADATGSFTITGDPHATGSYSGPGSTLTFSGAVIVGENAAATLTINQGSQVTYNGPGSADNGIELGDNAKSSGTVFLSDSGSSVTTPILDVGNNGSGLFTVQNGATLTSEFTFMGFGSGSGTLSINGGGQSGTGASLGTAVVGFNGYGGLNISGGATVTATSLAVAIGTDPPDNDPNGSVSISGNNSTLTINGNVIDANGADNVGVISVQDGAFFTANTVALGTDDGYGRLTVEGGGATATINENLNVYTGNSTTAAIEIGANSTLTDSSNVLIDVSDYPGIVVPTTIVAGSGALWNISGNLAVGQEAYGLSFVQDGGHENVQGNLILGQSEGTIGQIEVSDSGSLFTVGGTSQIGDDGKGFLGFSNGAQGTFTGAVTVVGGLFLGLNSDPANSGTMVTTNALDVDSGQVDVTNGATLICKSTVDIEENGSVLVDLPQSTMSAPSIMVEDGGLFSEEGASVSVNGTITVGSSGIADADSNSAISANGTTSAGTLYVYGTYTDSVGITQTGGQIRVGVGGNLTTPGDLSEASGTGTVQIDSGGTLSVDNATVGGGYTFTTDKGGTAKISGALTINGTVKDNGIITVGSGTILNGGSLGGSGTFNGNLTNGGKVAPGDPQTLTINGNYTQMAIGNLVLVLEGDPSSGNNDKLDVTGELSIDPGATLTLAFENGYAPTAGQVFDLIDYGSLNLDPTKDTFGLGDVTVTGLEAGFLYGVAPAGLGGTEFQLTALNNGIATTTPEPSTWALLLTGSALLACRLRRRNTAPLDC